MSDIRYWLGFNLVPHIGPMRMRALMAYFEDLETAWRADATHLRAAGLPQNAVQELMYRRLTLDLDAELLKVTERGLKLLCWESEGYPALLKSIDQPPPVLYVDGSLTADDGWAVAVVGTRDPSAYGLRVAQRFAAGLAENGVTVVSGLALGIDGAAHRAALEAGGRTLAVLGCGLDDVYPARHRALAEEIRRHGALVSDYPLGTRPEPANFPPRNRIISGLSLGTLVVEAGERSGALITVHFALEQGRETFAVPGSIDSRKSVGTNTLLQRGEAKPAMSVADILVELNLSMVPQQRVVRQVVPETPAEIALLQHISAEPTHLDDLVRRSGLDTSVVSSTLTIMELKGLVRRVEGTSYVLGY